MVRTTAVRFTWLLLNLANLTESYSVVCSYIQEQQPNQFHCSNQNLGFVKIMDQNVAKHRIGIRMKKWWWYPVYLNDRCCSLECVSIVLYYQNKGDESLPLLAFRRDIINAFFPEYSKEGNLSPSHIGIRNIPSDVCYDDTKHC